MAVARAAKPNQAAFPAINAALTRTDSGPPDSGPATPWHQLFRALWLRTGGEAGVSSDALSSKQDGHSVLLAMAMPIQGDGVPQPFAPAVGASPFAYQAPFRGTVVVQGGTVSAVTMTRGASVVTWPAGSVVPVFTGDVVTVTYSVAPTITMVGA